MSAILTHLVLLTGGTPKTELLVYGLVVVRSKIVSGHDSYRFKQVAGATVIASERCLLRMSSSDLLVDAIASMPLVIPGAGRTTAQVHDFGLNFTATYP